MENIIELWKETDRFVVEQEKIIIDKNMSFFKRVAKHYLSEGREVYFRENLYTHYGEGGFGRLLVTGEEDKKVADEYISDIDFENEWNKKSDRGYKKITRKNIKDIKYGLHSGK